MAYVLDTNIVSEFMRPNPNFETICWAQDHIDDVLITTVTIMELRYGIMKLPEGKRKIKLKSALDAIMKDCKERVLDFDSFSAYLCASLRHKAQSVGRVPQISDCMIAAICKRNDAALVTHNVKDFDYLDIEVIDPFEYESETLKDLKKREDNDVN